MLTVGKMADNYNRAFPGYPPLACTDRWLYGVWMIGNDYRGRNGYYGEYPPRFLARVVSMFGDLVYNGQVLHLFSGSLGEELPGQRFDIKPRIELKNGTVIKPDITGDAHQLSELVAPGFHLIIADPPYSEEDARHYGVPLVNRNKVVKECVKVLAPGGFLCWLDQVKPMYRKDQLALIGTIGIDRSTNHRVRMLYIFREVARE